jgi:hypothetical protein
LDFDNPADYRRYWDGRDPSDKTFVVRSGRGYQVWVRDPRLDPAETRLDFRPFIDLEVRANRHFVVATPSVHPSGRTHTVEGTFKILSTHGVVDSVQKHLKQMGYKGRTKRWPLPKEASKGATEGNRNVAAFVMSRFLLFTLHLSEQDAWYSLREWNESLNRPPLPQNELERTLESARRYPKVERPQNNVMKVVGLLR